MGPPAGRRPPNPIRKGASVAPSRHRPSPATVLAWDADLLRVVGAYSLRSLRVLR